MHKYTAGNIYRICFCLMCIYIVSFENTDSVLTIFSTDILWERHQKIVSDNIFLKIYVFHIERRSITKRQFMYDFSQPGIRGQTGAEACKLISHKFKRELNISQFLFFFYYWVEGRFGISWHFWLCLYGDNHELDKFWWIFAGPKRGRHRGGFQFSPFITARSDLYNRLIWLYNFLIWPL